MSVRTDVIKWFREFLDETSKGIGVPRWVEIDDAVDQIFSGGGPGGGVSMSQVNNAVSTHNNSLAAHPAIQQKITDAEAAIPVQITLHNNNGNAHPGIRQMITDVINSLPIQISNHNNSGTAHPSILQGLIDGINALVAHNISASAHALIQNNIQDLSDRVDTVEHDVQANMPDVQGAIAAHNQSSSAHTDLRQDIDDIAQEIVVLKSMPGGGIEEAPDDNKSYARKNKAWAEISGNVDISGKVDKVPAASEDSIMVFDAAGNAKDSGIKIADIKLQADGEFENLEWDGVETGLTSLSVLLKEMEWAGPGGPGTSPGAFAWV